MKEQEELIIEKGVREVAVLTPGKKLLLTDSEAFSKKLGIDDIQLAITKTPVVWKNEILMHSKSVLVAQENGVKEIEVFIVNCSEERLHRICLELNFKQPMPFKQLTDLIVATESYVSDTEEGKKWMTDKGFAHTRPFLSKLFGWPGDSRSIDKLKKIKEFFPEGFQQLDLDKKIDPVYQIACKIENGETTAEEALSGIPKPNTNSGGNQPGKKYELPSPSEPDEQLKKLSIQINCPAGFISFNGDSVTATIGGKSPEVHYSFITQAGKASKKNPNPKTECYSWLIKVGDNACIDITMDAATAEHLFSNGEEKGGNHDKA